MTYWWYKEWWTFRPVRQEPQKPEKPDSGFWLAVGVAVGAFAVFLLMKGLGK